MPEKQAPQSALRMYEGDALMQQMGASLDATGHVQATLSLTVTSDKLQAHGTCHGGAIFSLADAAFGVACNSGEHPAVAQHCSISYMKPARLGDTLTARIAQRSVSGRTGIFDGTVVNQDNALIAEFRGISRSLPPRK